MSNECFLCGRVLIERMKSKVKHNACILCYPDYNGMKHSSDTITNWIIPLNPDTGKYHKPNKNCSKNMQLIFDKAVKRYQDRQLVNSGSENYINED